MEKSPAWKTFLKSFLTAYAFTAVFHNPLVPAHYETTPDFIIATVYELLGNYDFKFFLLLFVGICFYKYMETKNFRKNQPQKACPCFSEHVFYWDKAMMRPEAGVTALEVPSIF